MPYMCGVHTGAQSSLARIIDVAVLLDPVLYSHICSELYFMSSWVLLLYTT